MFGGARLFPAANGSQAFAMGHFNGDEISDLAVADVGAPVSRSCSEWATALSGGQHSRERSK